MKSDAGQALVSPAAIAIVNSGRYSMLEYTCWATTGTYCVSLSLLLSQKQVFSLLTSHRLCTDKSFYKPRNSDANICDAMLLVYALENACDNLVGADLITSLKAFA